MQLRRTTTYDSAFSRWSRCAFSRESRCAAGKSPSLRAGRRPAALLLDLAQALQLSIDELLGRRPLKTPPSPKTARLLKRLQQVERLPRADQQAVLKFVDALVTSRGRAGRRRA